MKTRLFAASAVFLALLSASMLVTAGQEKGKDGGKDGGGDKDTHLRRASVLSGMPVVDPQGEQAGTINDIMIDLNTGKIVYFAVRTGGVAGVGSRYHAFGTDAVKLTTGKETGRALFSIAIDDKKLADEKGFDTNDWPRRPTYPGGKDDGGKDGGKDDGGKDGGKDDGGKDGGKDDKDTVERWSKINGMDVVSAKDGNQLGDVFDLMIDTRDWKVHYAAISTALVGGRLYAVDWKALKLKAPSGATDTRIFQVNATRADLDRAKGFVSTDNWPTNPDPAFSGGARDGDKGGDRDNGKGKEKDRD